MSMNLLIVDDSTTVRRVIARALQISGVEVAELFEAENGQDALRIMADKRVDLVLSDISMPFMDGEEMVREMGRKSALADIPVVMISSAGSEPRVQRLLDLGVKEFLPKPFTPEQIGEVVNRHAKGGVA